MGVGGEHLCEVVKVSTTSPCIVRLSTELYIALQNEVLTRPTRLTLSIVICHEYARSLSSASSGRRGWRVAIKPCRYSFPYSNAFLLDWYSSWYHSGL